MTHRTRILACLVSIVTLGIALRPDAQEQPPRPDFAADLRARHPEITSNPDFRGWADGSLVGPWHEVNTDATRRTVIIQNDRGDRVFAALIAIPGQADVLRTAKFDLTAQQQTRSDAIKIAESNKLPSNRVKASRPVVTFRQDGQADFSWELDFATDSRLETYQLIDKKLLKKSSKELPNKLSVAPSVTGAKSAVAATLPKPMAPPDPAADDLASNELHHISTFAADAATWTKGLTTVHERVQRVTTEVFNRYRYDATLPNIDVFTWSDELTVKEHAKSGVCDEIAVVAVSHLRSLGIRSRMKLLVWQKPEGGAAAHAAVEYFDGSNWKHTDPTWNRFNNPAVYRTEQGAKSVTVMDADFPKDSRSSVAAWGVPEPSGDGKLHPYFDFVLMPAFPGNARAGYSN